MSINKAHHGNGQENLHPRVAAATLNRVDLALPFTLGDMSLLAKLCSSCQPASSTIWS